MTQHIPIPNNVSRIATLLALIGGLILAIAALDQSNHAAAQGNMVTVTGAKDHYQLTRGDSRSFNVKLSSMPSATDRIFVRLNIDEQFKIDPHNHPELVRFNNSVDTGGQTRLLVFASSNWNSNQSVAFRVNYPGRVLLTHQYATASSNTPPMSGWSTPIVFSAISYNDHVWPYLGSANDLWELQKSQSFHFPLRMRSAPPDGKTVFINFGVADQLATDPPVIRYSSAEAGTGGQHRVITYDSNKWGKSNDAYPHYIHFKATNSGRVTLTYRFHLGTADNPPDINDNSLWTRWVKFRRITVYQANHTDAIMIKERTSDHPWEPVIVENNKYTPFDHIMGESEHVTYDVVITDQAACPATVDVRGRPRYVTGGESTYNHRIRVIAGSAPPPLTNTEAYKPLGETFATLQFTGAQCQDTPQQVTVYGLTDTYCGQSACSYNYGAAYIILKHTLSKRAGAATYERGPEFKVYAEDRHIVELSAAVPPGTADTTSHPFTTSTRITLVNNVGPSSRAGQGIPVAPTHLTHGYPVRPYAIPDNHTTYVRLPVPATATTETEWVEFCIYIHGTEQSLQTDNRYGNGANTIHLYRYRPSGLGLQSVTPVPFEYLQRGHLTTHINTHYQLPIELQRYTEVDSDNSQCRPASVFDPTTDTDRGQWQTVYSGGPTTLNADGSPSGTGSAGTALNLPQSDWGKLINVRMRAAYGLPITGVTDTTKSGATITTGMNSEGAWSYRAPQGTMQLRFTLAEIMGAESKGAIVINFANP